MSEETKAKDQEIAIQVDDISKVFRLPHEKNSSLKSTVINFRRRGYELQQALKDISFEVKKGEFFGIVGRNGSGKSTLLKIIAGIYVPTTGSVKINGSLAPFIELGVGFNQELTGRENVFLNGALLGFSRKQMLAMYDEIVEFAELERFMDQKLKNYSSGMQVRLAFSIAIQAKASILLLDEVLAVGDSAFQRKCLNFFKELKETDRTVVLVTHSMATVEEYCDRAMMLDDSKLVGIGDPMKISLQYELANSPTSLEAAKNKRPREPKIRIKNVSVRSQRGKSDQFSISDDLIVDVELEVKKKQTIQLSLGIFNMEGDNIAGFNSTEDMVNFTPSVGKHRVSCRLDAGQLPKGIYRLNVAIYSDDSKTPELIDVVSSDYGAASPVVTFTDKSLNKNGKFLIKGEWQTP